MTVSPLDESNMEIALQQARRSGELGEVPIGAACFSPAGDLLAAAGNAPIAGSDPSAHAEILCLRAAGRRLGNYRLDGCSLFVTVEPCPMCAGAIINARIGRLVFGAPETKSGAAGSVIDLFADGRINHHAEVVGGVRRDECAALLGEFFRARRCTPAA